MFGRRAVGVASALLLRASGARAVVRGAVTCINAPPCCSPAWARAGARAASGGAGGSSDSSFEDRRSITLPVGDTWGHLVSSGVYASVSGILQRLTAKGSAAVRGIEAATGATIRTDRGRDLVAVSGPRAAVARAQRALDELLVPAIVIDVEKDWSELLATGVHASRTAAIGRLIGPRGETVRAIEDASGASILVSPEGDRVMIFGAPAVARAAHAAVNARVVPGAVIDVAKVWGRLIEAGVHATPDEIVGRLIGHTGGRVRELERDLGVTVWPSRDSALVYVAGDAAGVTRARAELDARVTPAATIYVSETWASLVASGAHASLHAAMGALLGVAGSRLQAIERDTGAAVWHSADCGRVFIAGPHDAVARASTAIGAAVMPGGPSRSSRGSGSGGGGGGSGGYVVGGGGGGVYATTAGASLIGGAAPEVAAAAAPVEIDVGATVRELIAAGVHASVDAAVARLLGPRGARLRAIEAATGVAVRVGGDGARLSVSGDAAAVAAARAAITSALTPAVTHDVAARWGHLVAGGSLPSRAALAAAVTRATAAVGARDVAVAVWGSRDGSRVFIAGGGAAGVAAAVAALDAAVAGAA